MNTLETQYPFTCTIFMYELNYTQFFLCYNIYMFVNSIWSGKIKVPRDFRS